MTKKVSKSQFVTPKPVCKIMIWQLPLTTARLSWLMSVTSNLSASLSLLGWNFEPQRFKRSFIVQCSEIWNEIAGDDCCGAFFWNCWNHNASVHCVISRPTVVSGAGSDSKQRKMRELDENWRKLKKIKETKPCDMISRLARSLDPCKLKGQFHNLNPFWPGHHRKLS